MGDSNTTSSSDSASSKDRTASTEKEEAGSSGAKGATAFGIAEAFTTPYAGGEWSTKWYSTQSPEQRAFLSYLFGQARTREQAAQANYNFDPESLSISALNEYKAAEARAAYERILSQSADEGYLKAQRTEATKAAMEEMANVNIAAAGRGSRSSAANRERGRVESDLGSAIAKIYADYDLELQNKALAAAGGLTGLDLGLRGQEYQRLLANQQTAFNMQQLGSQQEMFNAEQTNRLRAAEMNYLLGLAGVQTGENIAVQSPARTLHSDLFGNKNFRNFMKVAFGTES